MNGKGEKDEFGIPRADIWDVLAMVGAFLLIAFI